MQVDFVTSLLPDVMVDCPLCPEPIATKEIRNAVIDFCQRSWFWQMDIDSLTSVANTAEYEIDNPSTTSRLIAITRAQNDTGKIPVRSETDMDTDSRSWRSTKGTYVSALVKTGQRTARMYPLPTVSGLVVTLRAAIKPAPTGSQIDDYVYDDYFQALAAGAKARLMLMPDKPWSNQKQAVIYARMFEAALSKAKVRAIKEFSTASLTVAPRAFGG